MRKHFAIIVTFLMIAVTIMFLMSSRPVSAVPSFSRLHNLECTACHTLFPRLNDFGMDFKQSGYRLPGEDGTYIWDQKALPISALAVLRFQNSHQDDPVTGARISTTTRFELDEIELMIAGTFAPKIGYFIEFEQEVADGEEFTANQAWVQFSDLLPASLLNLRAGVMLNEFYYLSQKRRLTFQAYLAPVTFNVTGVELNGTWSGLRYAAGIVNDERTFGTRGDKTTTGGTNTDDQIQGYYAWLRYAIAGQFIGVRYINTKSNSAAAPGGGTSQQLGGNLNLRYGPGEIILAYIYNWGLGGVQGQDRGNFLVEGILEVLPEKLLLDSRFELQNTVPVMGGNNPSTPNGTLVSVNASYYLIPSLRLIAEFDKVSGEGTDVFVFPSPNTSATTSGERYLVGLQIGF